MAFHFTVSSLSRISLIALIFGVASHTTTKAHLVSVTQLRIVLFTWGLGLGLLGYHRHVWIVVIHSPCASGFLHSWGILFSAQQSCQTGLNFVAPRNVGSTLIDHWVPLQWVVTLTIALLLVACELTAPVPDWSTCVVLHLLSVVDAPVASLDWSLSRFRCCGLFLEEAPMLFGHHPGLSVNTVVPF